MIIRPTRLPPEASPITVHDLSATVNEDATTVTAAAHVDPDGPYLRGHFPGDTVFPGVFLLELLDRAVSAVEPPGTRLVEVESARFTAPARGGDVVRLSVRVPHGLPEVPAVVDATFTGLDGIRLARVRARFSGEGPS
ncbi:hypothetical protein [Qaidamihabitans albus]|uniref:hypothetical protein n=1 Tax=Qaidamihabitans albus TaxID=2795733 RepID=UPI0018F1110D|nr:hypothetical protein [Qaidamihabitans albus]